MDYVIIALVALGASILTFFSGFGLGTLLLPVFGIFFPIEVAVAATALTHFSNNLFKLALTRKNINWPVALKFGIPAAIAAFAGANLLNVLQDGNPVFTYSFYGTRTVTWPKLVIGILMLLFALTEILPSISKISFDKKYLPAGGLLSGFFGGLSGHQGALRSMFLIKLGLDRFAFVATGVVIACLIDAVRISTYLYQGMLKTLPQPSILITAVLAAVAGALAGNYLLKKVELKQLQWFVAIFIGLFAMALITGLA